MTAVTLLLLLIGTILIYSTTFNAKTIPEGAGSLTKQLAFIILGLGIYFLLVSFDFSWLKIRKVQLLLYILIIALLIFVLFTDPVNNARRWINIGFINIQPSEFSKLVIIILTAGIFIGSDKQKIGGVIKWDTEKKSKTKGIYIKKTKLNISNFFKELNKDGIAGKILISLVLTIPIIYLIFIQPAFGSSVIVFLIWISLIFAVIPGQSKIFAFLIITLLSTTAIWKLFTFQELYQTIGINLIVNGYDLGIIIISLLSVAFLLSFTRLKIFLVPLCLTISLLVVPAVNEFNNKVLTEYQRQRIETFFNPEKDVQGSGWQVNQSKIAIGSGRLWGRGFLQGTQSRLRFLPFAHTDFIFAALGEQFGLVGCSFVLLLFAILVSRVLWVATHTKDSFGTTACIGVATMLILHIFINIGMNLGKLPVTGIPLPLVSYGGSSVLVNLIALGIVQSIATSTSAVDSSEHLMVVSEAPWRE